MDEVSAHIDLEATRYERWIGGPRIDYQLDRCLALYILICIN